MNKRYQVFVSSTYADLKEERQHVLQALMEMDCIPADMELFPAADEEQWTFIQKIIDDCDYYLLIIGGRYGSVTPDGISYTEKEFDYAVDKGLKIVALIHSEPSNIPFGKSESDSQLRKKLSEFRDKVMDGRLVKFWKSAEELPGLVALSLTKTIKMYPAIGWVRANKIASDELLIEINQLRKENQKLKEECPEYAIQENYDFGKIADFDEKYIINGHSRLFSSSSGYYKQNWNYSYSWKNIFSIISPTLLKDNTSDTVQSILANSIAEEKKQQGDSHTISTQDFMTITLQLKAYGLIDTYEYGSSLKWKLTKKGNQYMMNLRLVPSSNT